MRKQLTDATRSLLKMVASNVISYDIYTLAVMAVYSSLAIVLYPFVPTAGSIILQDLLIAVTIGALILLWGITRQPLFGLLRRFYIIPVIYIMYDQVHAFVRVVNPNDVDSLFISIDAWLFGGVNPTQWLESYSTPIVTEYLQICYFLFYVLPIMHAVELYRRGDIELLDRFARGMAFCYFISYVAYFGFPAIGPRFTLHDYHQLNETLPGILVTPWLRSIVDVGGGLAIGSENPAALVNRDCMPSGHTMMTLVNILLAFSTKSKFRWIFVVIGGSLIFSTVYLRYHYVVDVLVGAALALICLPLEPVADRALRRFVKKITSMV
jgi:membrane-associated phospholipid phosphatase